MSAPQGYSKAQIWLHWIIAVLILLQFLFHEGMEEAWRALNRGEAVTGNAAQIHVFVGILVLALVVVRLILRFRRGVPDLPPDGNPLQDLAAKLTHAALYVLLVLIPVSGMAAWFGGVGVAGGAHGAMFAALMILILLHIAAALYHQFVLKDGLISRMMRSK